METPRILIVEDDRIIARHLEHLLQKLGYRITASVSNGADAISSAHTTPPDLILMDIVLEGELDGIQTAEQIRHLANLPIIFLTAFADEAILQRARVTDPFGYVLKPFDERNLHATIEMALQKHRLELRLRETQDRYIAVVEQASEGILLIDPENYLVIEANLACLHMIGKEKLEIIGQPVYQIFGVHFEHFKREFEHLLSQGQIDHGAQHVRRPDGTDCILDINLAVITYSRQRMICGMVRDITERRRADEQTQRQMERLASLRLVEMSITGRHDLQGTLATLLEQITTQLKVDAASILLLSPDQVLCCAAHRGFKTLWIEKTALRFGEGYAGLAAQERRIVHASNLDNPYESQKFIPILLDEGFVSYFGLPLVVKDAVIGVLEVFQRSRLEPSVEWLEFLKILAGQAAIAIDNISLFDQQQAANRLLEIAYEATIEGWSRALELRDQETEGHTRRVSEMSVRLARSLGLSEQQVNQIRLGSLLHDIGKMGIPDSILLKPGPLTPEEWEKMRQHPLYAFRLLSPVEYLQPALEVAYCHHERWDGTGYPRRLAGADIPLLARIFAVIDVWDSLLNDRPYRARWDVQDVRRHILENSGSHFDPAVVQAFMQLDIWESSSPNAADRRPASLLPGYGATDT
jgi:PAS domain S-box-containing protein